MRSATQTLVVVFLAAATTLIVVGRSSPPVRDAQPVRVDPARFTVRIDNPSGR